MNLYFSNTIKGLLHDKINSVFKVLLLAIATLIPILSGCLVVSFAGQSFLELEEISAVLHFYTTDTSNSIYKLCNSVTISLLMVGFILVAIVMFISTSKKKNVLKNHLVMGASYFQILVMTIVENLIIYVVGFIVGVIFAVGIVALVLLICATEIIVPAGIIWISFLLNLGAVLMVSVLIPLWQTTSQIKRK